MVHRREHFEIFDQAFQLFWRDPEAAAHAAAMARAGLGIALLPTFIEGSLVDLQPLTAPIAAPVTTPPTIASGML